jgi:hypothetical protein
MNDSELRDFLGPLGNDSSWAAKCVSRLLKADNLRDIAEGLVAQNGHKPVKLVKDAWGIDIATCYAYCGRQKFPMVLLSPYQHNRTKSWVSRIETTHPDFGLPLYVSDAKL